MKHLERYKIFEAKYIHEESFPSEDFGKSTGMDWIYVNWKLPFSAEECAKKVSKWSDDLSVKSKAEKAAEEISKFLGTLFKENPEFRKLGEPTSWTEVIDFCNGAISKFNIDDIKFYTKLDWNDKIKYNMGNRKTMEEIEAKAKSSIGWVMSPETIARVKKELKMK